MAVQPHLVPLEPDGLRGTAQEHKQDAGIHCKGQYRGTDHPGNPPVEHGYRQKIQGDVQEIGRHQAVERGLPVSAAAENGRFEVVQSQKRHPQKEDPQIGGRQIVDLFRHRQDLQGRMGDQFPHRRKQHPQAQGHHDGRPIKVYNFEVEDFHTYFVGECGVLVHNDCNTGKYKELRGEEGKESHHIIQNASVKDMPGYSSSNAPAISLEGPSTRMGTEHYKATQFQSHNNYGGTYGDERKVAYISLRKAGKTKEEAFQAINYADKYFVGELGWDFTTITSIPKNRR